MTRKNVPKKVVRKVGRSGLHLKKSKRMYNSLPLLDHHFLFFAHGKELKKE